MEKKHAQLYKTSLIKSCIMSQQTCTLLCYLMCQPMWSSVTCISSIYLSCHLHRYYIITQNSPNQSIITQPHPLSLSLCLSNLPWFTSLVLLITVLV